MSAYYKAMAAIEPKPVAARGMTREQIEAAVANINEILKGPLSNSERILLYADRKDLRAALDEQIEG